MLIELTDTQIEQRLEFMEMMISAERDTKTLASYSETFRSLIDEQARRATDTLSCDVP